MSAQNIIDKVIPQTRSREIVRQMIPILIRWAKLGLTDKTYNDMNHALGYTKFSGIGHQLGNIDIVMKELEKETGMKGIPTLNALCKNSVTHLPSPGFSFVYTSYKDMSPQEKQIFVTGLNQEAIQYEYWDRVLKELELEPAAIFTDEELQKITKPLYGSGGEGKEHKALKEYIAAHPKSIGIRGIEMVETEFPLPSGDRLDVFFALKDGSCVAVEIKPTTSPDEDISRGVFQCVKYKAVLDAAKAIRFGNYAVVKTLLVCGGIISSKNKQLAEDLGIKYIESFQKGKPVKNGTITKTSK